MASAKELQEKFEYHGFEDAILWYFVKSLHELVFLQFSVAFYFSVIKQEQIFSVDLSQCLKLAVIW